MPQRLSLTALLVDEYDPAIAFFVDTLGFELREDSDLGDGKRWVVSRRAVRQVACCWRARSVSGSALRSAIRAAGAYSCSSRPTTSRAITAPMPSGVSAS